MKFSTLRKALILLAMAVAVAVPVCAFSGSGSGTSDDPYLITSYEQLNEMRNDTDASYKLSANIIANDPAVFEYTEGEISGVADTSSLNVWKPFDFSGSFDNGTRYYITGIYVPEDYADGGFFATLTDASIAHLYLDFALIEADENAGIIAAKAEGTTVIDDCLVSGSVIGKTTKEMNNLGGMVGVLGENATITSSHATTSKNANVSYAVVTGATSYTSNVGGIAGLNYGTIENAIFAGKVYGTATYYDASIGGIAGYNTGSISNCRTEYGTVGGESTAKVNDCFVGGIAGVNKGVVEYNANAASITAENYSNGDSIVAAGGIVGMNLDTDLMYNTNSGAVGASGTDAYSYNGGIAGIAVADTTGTKYIQYNDNTGAITSGYGVAGGIVGRAVAAGEGYVSIKLVISGCYNSGAVSGNATGEMAGETGVVDSASVTVGDEGAANANTCDAYYASVMTAESVQYGSKPTGSLSNTSGVSLTVTYAQIDGTDRYILRTNAARSTAVLSKPVMVTLVTVTDASKLEILSVDVSGLTLSGTTLSGNVVVKVYKPADFTAASAVTGFSADKKYAATSFATLKAVSEGRVEDVTVPVNVTVAEGTTTITVNALVVSDTDSMEPLCENVKVSK